MGLSHIAGGFFTSWGTREAHICVYTYVNMKYCVCVYTYMYILWGFPSGSAVKNPPAVQEPQEMQVWSVGQEDPLEEGMENPMDRGAWWAVIHSIAKSWTQLKRLSMLMHTVIFSSFVFCYWRRHLSRCRLCSKKSWIPAHLTTWDIFIYLFTFYCLTALLIVMTDK